MKQIRSFKLTSDDWAVLIVAVSLGALCLWSAYATEKALREHKAKVTQEETR